MTFPARDLPFYNDVLGFHAQSVAPIDIAATVAAIASVGPATRWWVQPNDAELDAYGFTPAIRLEFTETAEALRRFERMVRTPLVQVARPDDTKSPWSRVFQDFRADHTTEFANLVYMHATYEALSSAGWQAYDMALANKAKVLADISSEQLEDVVTEPISFITLDCSVSREVLERCGGWLAMTEPEVVADWLTHVRTRQFEDELWTVTDPGARPTDLMNPKLIERVREITQKFAGPDTTVDLGSIDMAVMLAARACVLSAGWRARDWYQFNHEGLGVDRNVVADRIGAVLAHTYDTLDANAWQMDCVRSGVNSISRGRTT